MAAGVNKQRRLLGCRRHVMKLWQPGNGWSWLIKHTQRKLDNFHTICAMKEMSTSFILKGFFKKVVSNMENSLFPWLVGFVGMWGTTKPFSLNLENMVYLKETYMSFTILWIPADPKVRVNQFFSSVKKEISSQWEFLIKESLNNKKNVGFFPSGLIQLVLSQKCVWNLLFFHPIKMFLLDY